MKAIRFSVSATFPALLAATLPMLAGVLVPAGAEAQEAEPRSFCFNGAPLPACQTFLIVEMQGVLPLVQTSREVSWYGGYAYEERPFNDELQWELGLMHNIGDAWAVGGAARLGAGSTGALTGLTLRARRWLSSDVGLDVAAGASFMTINSPDWRDRSVGWLADARLNFNDDVYAGLRFEQFALDPFTGPDAFDPGGPQGALSLLLGVGSEWAVGGSAAVGAALLLLFATVDWD